MKIKSATYHLAQLSFFAAVFLTLLTGCDTTQNPKFSPYSSLPPKDAKDAPLGEGDVVKIAFPGATTLDTVQTIRRDGKITLPVVGEVVAAEKTPTELQKELVKLYANELVSSKEITVTVQASSFSIFVTGAVLKPGKLLSDRPITALEAIMESGGPDYNRANLKAVRIIRTQDNRTRNYTINLKGLVNGTPIDIFYLRPNDIVYIPEKITWL